jgi:hypothetical protein
MRQLADEARIRRFMRALGASTHEETRAYFTGGTSAVLRGSRPSTIDVDVAFVPDRDELLRLLPRLKEELQLNIELVSPSDFLPELPGWEERSQFIAREGVVSFFHYDFYAQALTKVERGHELDLADVRSMMDAGLVEPAKLSNLFDEIAPRLYRYPAVDAPSLKAAIEAVVNERKRVP